MKIGTVEVDQLRGMSDKVLGLGKEIFGALVGNDRLQEAGEAQQAKGSESLKAFRKQVEAEKHQAKAEAHEKRQRVAQRAKQSA